MAMKAVFLDRDGTIMEDPGYLADPAGVKLLPGVDLAVKSLRQAGYKIIVVTNQSGVARGMLTEDTLEKIHGELRRKLAEKGAMLDAIYYCPFHPEGTVPQYTKESDLRKPAPGMLYQAAKELDLDLKASWMVGDAGRDVEAGRSAGCRTILLPSPNGDQQSPDADNPPDLTARNVVEAAKLILRASPKATPVPVVPAAAAAAPTPAAAQEPPVAPAPAKATLFPDTPTTPSAAPQSEKNPQDDPQDDSKENPPMEEYNQPEASNPKTEMPTDTPDRVFTVSDSPVEEDSNIRKEILRHVRQMSKQAETVEFSLVNLLGGVAQILVVLLLLVVFWKALGKQDFTQAMLWAIVAVVMQTMSMTFFLMARNKR